MLLQFKLLFFYPTASCSKPELRDRCVARPIQVRHRVFVIFLANKQKSFPNLNVCLPTICDVRNPNLKTR